MQVSDTSLPGVYEIEPRVFEDSRGFFLETYRTSRYDHNDMSVEFRQSNHTHSAHRTLRGLHYQMARPQGKLVYAARGEVLDVAVDIRRGSPHLVNGMPSYSMIQITSNYSFRLTSPMGFACSRRRLI